MVMRPAFSSTRQAAAFALLLLATLLAPVMAQKILPSREEIYSSIWWVWGDFPYMDYQIFREKSDIDIIFMGSSHIWGGINTPYVQEQLGKELGRPAVARTFGWAWPGYDPLYAIGQDLINHRAVHMPVFDDNCGDSDQPHPLSPRLFRFGEDAETLSGLPAPIRVDYYLASVIGMPRNFLEMVRSNLPADLNAHSYWETHGNALNIASNLGAITTRSPFRGETGPFVPFTPNTDAQPSDVCIYSAETKTNFDFSGEGIPSLQLYFARRVAALAKENSCKLVVIHMPRFDERRSTTVSMPAFWPDALHTDVTMIGIPPAALFKGLSDDDVRKLYGDNAHFNANGQKYFTSLITPSLIKIYESKNP